MQDELSETEEQPKRTNKAIGIGLSMAIGIAVWFLLRGYEKNQPLVGGIFAATVVLWITETLPLGITALLSTTLLVLIGNVPEKTAFSAYGDPIIPLFIGSFLLAKAMDHTGLGRRLAWLFLSRKVATRSGSMLLLSLGIIACVLSLFVSNTAVTAMMLPIGLSILGDLKVDSRAKPYSIAALLMLTWGSSIAVGVPVGTPPNLIGISLIEKATSVKIGFVQWMIFAMPITILMLLGCWVILRLLYGRQDPSTAGTSGEATEALAELGPITLAERNTLLAFFAALALWMIPDLSAIALGDANEVAKWLQGHIPASVPAVVAAALLFVLPAGRGERALTWKEGATIDWGTILLFGGGIALGQAMFSSGLANTLGQAAAQLSGANTLWTITALSIAASILLSELASNTAAATTLVPVAIALAQGANVSPIPPALGVALGASLGFMLPVSTAPNAIVYSSGLIPPKEMMKAGVLIDVLGFVVTLVCLWLFLPLAGLH